MHICLTQLDATPCLQLGLPSFGIFSRVPGYESPETSAHPARLSGVTSRQMAVFTSDKSKIEIVFLLRTGCIFVLKTREDKNA